MSRQIFSISGLANELGRDRRTLGLALRNVRPDDETPEGRAGWTILTALAALCGEVSPRGYDTGDHIVRQRIADEIERAAGQVEDALRRLRAEPNIGKRRSMAQAGLLKVFGELDRALLRSVEIAAE